MPTAGSPIQRLKALLRAREHTAALALIDQLLPTRPDDGPLHWHRARCLEALGRGEEALAAVERVVALRPDYAPAWIKRAELAAWSPAEAPRIEQDVRHALSLDPGLARGHYLLALLLDQGARREEAEAALGQSIALDPNDPDFYLLRARWAESAAWSPAAGEETVEQFSGPALSRPRLESALADLERALALNPGDNRTRLRRARLLHPLRRFDEALAEYDRLLAGMAADDPMREVLLEMRHRSEGEGAGERDDFARLLEQGIQGEEGERVRRTDDALVDSVVRATAAAVRSGERLEDLLAEFVSDDPDEILALNIAESIHRVGSEPAPEFAPAEVAQFSRDQRRFAARIGRALAALGFAPLGDFDPVHLHGQLSRRTLLRVARSPDGEIAAVAFRLMPNWPGWVAYLLMVVLRKWRVPEVLELESGFDDGGFLTTNNTGGFNPFTYGEKINLLALPPRTAPAELLRRHQERIAAYREAHPDARLIPVTDLAQLEALQRAFWAAKQAYRRSVGYVLEEELHNLLGTRYDALAPKVRRKLERLVEISARQPEAA